MKKSNEKVRPWNFEDTIDLEASAEKFIRRMTNKCTYLLGEDVIPKDSLLYAKYMVLNELNNLTINGEKISTKLKQKIFDDKFKTTKKVTIKQLKDYLISEGYCSPDDQFEIGGIDGSFKTSLTGYNDFKIILGKDCFSNREENMIEDIIKWIVLFTDDKKILEAKIHKEYGSELTAEQLKKIKNLKYRGWGRFSRKFLNDIFEIDWETGEIDDRGRTSIIEALYSYDGNPNLMSLLSNNYGFMTGIEWHNKAIKPENRTSVEYADLDELYVSVPVKRSIWQTISIVKELKSILGRDPKKIFIEMPRGGGKDDKGRKSSRKNLLQELYKACGADSELMESLDKEEDNRLRRDKLYLYYTQLGRCMYSGHKIDLEDLSKYDIDHIYPQSKVMDDSLNNRVLVEKVLNAEKSDQYPIKDEWQERMKKFWGGLKDKGLISEIKLNKLIRKEEFSEGELAGFVGRQIVETGQSAKVLAHLFEEIFADTEIVYVKAKNVSAFRQGVDDCDRGKCSEEIRLQRENKFIKVREINDYHHAKDAYLNIVVGNVFNSKFTSNPYAFLRSEDNRYSLNAMYRFKVVRNGITAWEPTTDGIDGTMSIVKKMMRRNNIQFTRYAKEVKGGLFDQQILKKGKGQVPLKANGAVSQIDKYGGYNKAAGTYFFLVEQEKNDKKVRTVEHVPLYLAKKIEENPEGLLEYCIKILGMNEPRILLNKIKFDTLFETEGFRMHITGRSSDILLFKNGNQLILDESYENYIKKIVKYTERKSLNRNLQINEEYDHISKKDNDKLYDLFTSKIVNSIYKVKLKAQIKNLEEGKDSFVNLDVEKQVEVLLQILNMLRCNSSTGNLLPIGCGKSCGTITLQKNITKCKELCIINQSVTGLFENKINLLEL